MILLIYLHPNTPCHNLLPAIASRPPASFEWESLCVAFTIGGEGTQYLSNEGRWTTIAVAAGDFTN